MTSVHSNNKNGSSERNNVYVVILCGGSGTRLWPLSRSIRPKHLISFDSEYSLLQETYLRINKKINSKNIIIVTNELHYFEAQRQLEDVSSGVEPKILSEPQGKNTLPAITLAVKEAFQIDSDAILCIFPSDHRIGLEEELDKVMNVGIKAAEENLFSLVGIKASYPATGYGYIKANLNTSKSSKGIILNKSYLVDKFIEKPSLKLAEKYVAENYLWNSGIFIFKASLFNSLMKKHQSSLMAIMQDITPDNIELKYEQLESVSIDYGLIEKIEEAYVIPANLEWSDLGNWDSIFSSIQRDKNFNYKHGNVIAINSNNSLLWNENKILATYGISDLIVVNTNDATLICHRNDSESVKNLVAELNKSYPEEVNTHLKVFRPWGTYEVLEEGENFKVKKIEVYAGKKLSMQYHNHRSEHWVVIQGRALVCNGDDKISLGVNESTFISAGVNHRLENPCDEKLTVIEVQSGKYVGEDDIVRIEDDYGREDKSI